MWNKPFSTVLGSLLILTAAIGTAYGLAWSVGLQLNTFLYTQEARLQQATTEANFYKNKAANLEKKLNNNGTEEQ